MASGHNLYLQFLKTGYNGDEMTGDMIQQFRQERAERVQRYEADKSFQQLSGSWLAESMARKYVYNFEWLGRPVIQYPQDMVAVQELVWRCKPDLIIETGIAHGGSLILSASLLALLEMFDAMENGVALDLQNPARKVIGIDIDIRAHNRRAIEEHPLAGRIEMFEGSSIDGDIIKKVHDAARGFSKVMVFLDSMHTHEHVLKELEGYAPLVGRGSYCVVFDTYIENMEPGFFPDRPWDVGNNPMTAVKQWLVDNRDFTVDREMETKLQVTVAPHGFLRRI